jgi:Flp pilus assembly pilin Flp
MSVQPFEIRYLHDLATVYRFVKKFPVPAQFGPRFSGLIGPCRTDEDRSKGPSQRPKRRDQRKQPPDIGTLTMKLLNILKTFRNDESGAVTVDWVVLTAAIVGLGLVVMTTVSGGLQEAATNISNDITGSTSTAPTPSQ